MLQPTRNYCWQVCVHHTLALLLRRVLARFQLNSFNNSHKRIVFANQVLRIHKIQPLYIFVRILLKQLKQLQGYYY